jgi:hypothetical protein
MNRRPETKGPPRRVQLEPVHARRVCSMLGHDSTVHRPPGCSREPRNWTGSGGSWKTLLLRFSPVPCMLHSPSPCVPGSERFAIASNRVCPCRRGTRLYSSCPHGQVTSAIQGHIARGDGAILAAEHQPWVGQEIAEQSRKLLHRAGPARAVPDSGGHRAVSEGARRGNCRRCGQPDSMKMRCPRHRQSLARAAA